MKATQNRDSQYERRLTSFLSQIKAVEQGKRKGDLYEIMDMPIFRDLETALMMATMDQGARR